MILRNLGQRHGARLIAHRMFPPSHGRFFSVATARRTEGVYKALTDMRVRTPWIEALRQRESDESPAKVAAEAVKPNLTPKRMKDSYFRFVGSSEGPIVPCH